MKNFLFVIGTRPEAIKLAPLIIACKKHPDKFKIKICLTGQHSEMLYQVMNFFDLKADYNIELMKPNQTLFDITADALRGLEKILNECLPDLVIVQGDTTTAFAGALSAYYKQIKVAHVEAGLRSNNKYSPFPEEINRKLTGIIADFHFAPTRTAADNLSKENIYENIIITGNTVIDALLWAVEKVRKEKKYSKYFSFLFPDKKIILVTGHRRENFGKPFENICDALNSLCEKYKDIQIIYPVHLNPNVQKIVKEKLSDKENIFLIDPLDYPHLVWLMDKCYFVITDSGGIQEEAPSLGKPVLVMRDVTERVEGIASGTAILVGTSKEKIVKEASELLENKEVYNKMSEAASPYGSGDSSEQIVSFLISNYK